MIMYISDTYFCQVLTFDYTCFIYFLKKQSEYKKYIAVYFPQSTFSFFFRGEPFALICDLLISRMAWWFCVF